MKENAQRVERIYTDIEWALSEGLPAGEVVPLLEQLIAEAEPASPHEHYAKRQLAELVVRREPFRAARLAQDVLACAPEDDRAHAALGLACLLMGHFKRAESAYREALNLVPHCPWYAHNLGHLLDAALGRSHEALPWLRLSRMGMPDDTEVASSYAHALLACGQETEAMAELLMAVDGDKEMAAEILKRWSVLTDSEEQLNTRKRE